MKAAILEDPAGGELRITDLQIDRPAAREVLIRNVGVGLCHSDLNYLDDPKTLALTPVGVQLPVLLGHECAGVVEAVGADVTYVRSGDHVITYPAQFCGECEFCLRGIPTLCRQSPGPRPADAPHRLTLPDGTRVGQFSNLGGFAELLLVHEHAVVKIDPEYPLDRAAVLSCGVATGLGSVLNAAQVRPGSTVAVLGCGGVGLAAIQGARVAGARRIVAIDTSAAKLRTAEAMGATDSVDASSGDVVAQVLELTGGGVDYSFEAVGLKSAAEQSFCMLRPGGLATIIGIGTGQRPEFDMRMFIPGRKIQGAAMGANRFRTDLPYFIDLDRQGRIDVAGIVEKHIALEDINTGFATMREGGLNGRWVVMF
ncbi:zinc-binding dehydrogenase [Sporichthya sp.]|uniref:zinc-binding dehydrogenase n=1 Tax=Sporichthya sp. TaxID=65475 RepID=UPI001841822A|nr:zinc-binding dehydrogenase [Sporichthya sp.]MBA3741414.1 zinc-binding dehydrogenase [Sporichthya sp.]